MSTLVVDATRPTRDPGRVFPPPPITAGGWALRWGFTGVCLLGMVGTYVAGAIAPPEFADGSLAVAPWRIALDAVLTLVAIWLVRLRRRWPLATVLMFMAMSVLSSGAGCFLPWVVVSVTTRRRWRDAALIVGATIVAQVLSLMLPWGSPGVKVNEQPVVDRVVAGGIALGFGTLWLVVLVAIGFYVGARRDLVASLTERAETAEREQRLMVEAGKAGERARIAREMHDVLAHRISLVSMHAGVLAYRDDLAPEQTKQIAGIIQENAHASLTELRQVLATLREPTTVGEHVEKPQPTLVDLETLVREAQLARTHVTVHNEIEDLRLVPPAVGRHAFRMIQEALTNARKHALGAPVKICLKGRPGKGLSLEVRNHMTADTGVPGAKLGLVGLGERAQVMGGTFEAGREQGDFVVRAWLPWEK